MYKSKINNKEGVKNMPKEKSLLEKYKAGEMRIFDKGDKLIKEHFKNIGGVLEDQKNERNHNLALASERGRM